MQPSRHPKTPLQLIPSYTGASLAVALSVALSVLLFWSISTDWRFSALFAGLAVIFELAKFTALPEIARRKSRGDWSGCISASLLFGVLAAASILGSIGGLQSDTQRVQATIQKSEQERTALVEERKLLLDEIAENQKAIDKYITLNRIKNFAKPLQEKNTELRKQASILQEKLNKLELVSETPMTAMLGAIATAVKKDKATVQVYIFILLAILLDLVAGFFIELIREENDFRKGVLSTEESIPLDAEQESASTQESTAHLEHLEVLQEEISESDTTDADNVISFSSKEDKYDDIRSAILETPPGKPVSKRSIMREFKIGQQNVNNYYVQLVEEGVLRQSESTGLYFRET
ncbi:hypothetical protein [Zooshikella sp. RANM57]|uniref:hypothetical protein n=1 Tax=Zooshikella sp. RANM57 TaxID=3425863 RepID=UPI003D6EBFDE